MGSGFVVNGQRDQVAGLDVTSWLDAPVLTLGPEDFRVRAPGTWIRAVVLHTTKGIPGGNDLRPQVIWPGFGPPVQAGQRTARYWSHDGRQAGAHLVIDHDGAISQTCDLQTVAAYHCPGWNTASIGIEIYQGNGAELYEGQLDVTVRVVDYLTRRFGIQRQIPHRYLGGPHRRFAAEARDVVAVIGHRDAASNRGSGDPGNAIFSRLGLAKYEAFDFESGDDRNVWKQRQIRLGLANNDGIPGPATRAALLATGKAHGMWVERPGDRELGAVPENLV